MRLLVKQECAGTFGAMADEKKCPSCGQWTEWSKAANDKCVHCQSALTPPTVPTHDEYSFGVGQNVPSFLTEREGDGLMMKGIRKMAMVAHLVYAAIMAAFMVVVATLVH